MWIDKALPYGADILLSAYAVYLFFYYFDIFFARKKSKKLWVAGLTEFVLWQFGISTIISLPAYVNIAVTVIVTLFAVTIIYEGMWWNKCVFVITFNAIWMLMETLSNYVLMIYCEQYASVQSIGSFVSKSFFLAVIIALKKVFTDDEIKELSVRYSIMLVLIPMGSIYIMNNVFMLGFTVNDNHTRINSAITVIILLGMNILIFYIYMKLADDLRLRRMASVYEQQLELCERHQQEREISILQLRDAKHNMKNNLVSILAYAENRQHEKIIGFIIDFQTDICIPMMLPFKGADICLILGNLLENAVEAAQKVDGKKYIEIKMKYDKNNILLSVTNSYSGKLLKTKDHRLKSTKTDAENHGVGLASVYRAVAKYCGTVIIDDSVSGQFKIRVLLYGRQE